MMGQGTYTVADGDKFEGRFEKNKFLNSEGHWIPLPGKYSFIE